MAFGFEEKPPKSKVAKTSFWADIAIKEEIELQKQNKENKNLDFDCPLLITNFPIRQEKEE